MAVGSSRPSSRDRRSETRIAADTAAGYHLDLRPQARGHLVEPLKLQIPKLRRLFDGLLTERGEFGPDVRVRRVHVDAELSRNSRYELPAFRSSSAIMRRSAMVSTWPRRPRWGRRARRGVAPALRWSGRRGMDVLGMRRRGIVTLMSMGRNGGRRIRGS